MSEFILATEKVEVGAIGETPSIDLGKTKGGIIFRQNAATEVEIDNDQDVEPESIITSKIRRELEINLADCKLSNLEMLFDGEIQKAPNDNILNLPEEAKDGVVKSIKITSKTLDGIYYTITMDRARIRPEGEIAVNNDGNAVLTLNVVNLAASDIPATLSFDNASPDANSKVTFTARTGGTTGNSITVAFVDPGIADQTLFVSVTGTDITVNLATDSGLSITSTADDVAKAVNGDVDASALVYAEASGDGSTVVEAHAQASLTGGKDLNAPKITKVTA